MTPVQPIFLVLLVALVAPTERLVPERPGVLVEFHAVVQDVPCEGTPKLNASGHIVKCRLAADHRIGMHLFWRGTELDFSGNGVLSHAALARETAFYGLSIPAGSDVFFDPEGGVRHFWLRAPAVMQGYRLRAKRKGLGHMVYPNGQFRAVWLATATEIDGIRCASSLPFGFGGWHAITLGAQAMAWFYPDGRLQQGMLAHEATIGGRAFKRGDVVSLHHDGTLDLTAPKLGDGVIWPEDAHGRGS